MEMYKDQWLELHKARIDFRRQSDKVQELLRQRNTRARAMISFNALLGQLADGIYSPEIVVPRQQAIVVACMAWKQGFAHTRLCTHLPDRKLEGMGSVTLRY